MSDTETSTDNGGEKKAPEPVPIMQRVLDNPFLLLFLGITVPAVLYIVWGVMEVASVPLAN
jgi:hypothetical protein